MPPLTREQLRINTEKAKQKKKEQLANTVVQQTPVQPPQSIQSAQQPVQQTPMSLDERKKLSAQQVDQGIVKTSKPQALGGVEPTQTRTIQRGDTLSQLARDFNTNIEDILRINPQITNPNLIFAGAELKLPTTAPVNRFAGASASEIVDALDTGELQRSTLQTLDPELLAEVKNIENTNNVLKEEEDLNASVRRILGKVKEAKLTKLTAEERLALKDKEDKKKAEPDEILTSKGEIINVKNNSLKDTIKEMRNAPERLKLIETSNELQKQIDEILNSEENIVDDIVKETAGESTVSSIQAIAAERSRSLSKKRISLERSLARINAQLRQSDTDIADTISAFQSETDRRQQASATDIQRQTQAQKQLEFIRTLSPTAIASISPIEMASAYMEAGLPSSAGIAFQALNQALAQELAKGDKADQSVVDGIRQQLGQVNAESRTSTEKDIATITKLRDQGVISQSQFDQALAGKIGLEQVSPEVLLNTTDVIPTGELITKVFNGRNVTLDKAAMTGFEAASNALVQAGEEELQIGAVDVSSTAPQAERIAFVVDGWNKDHPDDVVAFDEANPNAAALEMQSRGVAVSTVGTHNKHSKGQAVDIFPNEEYIAKVKPFLEAAGWEQTVPNGDSGHFEFQAKTPLLNKFLEIAKKEGLTGEDARNFALKRVEDSFSKMTEAQGKAFKSVFVAEAENKLYNSLSEGIDPEEFANSINFLNLKIKDRSKDITSEVVNRWIVNPKIQQAIMAEVRFVSAILREESGAAISAEEYLTKGGAFFPRAGDGIGAIENKADGRLREIAGLKGKIGLSGQRQLEESAQREVSTRRSEQLKRLAQERTKEIERIANLTTIDTSTPTGQEQFTKVVEAIAALSAEGFTDEEIQDEIENFGFSAEQFFTQ